MENETKGFDLNLLNDLADLYKIFGDFSRLRMLAALEKGEKCVFEISEELSMTQSAVSHQLRLLRASRLVKCRRDGKEIRYSLADDHVSAIMHIGMEHLMESDHRREL